MSSRPKPNMPSRKPPKPPRPPPSKSAPRPTTTPKNTPKKTPDGRSPAPPRPAAHPVAKGTSPTPRRRPKAEPAPTPSSQTRPAPARHAPPPRPSVRPKSMAIPSRPPASAAAPRAKPPTLSPPLPSIRRSPSPARRSPPVPRSPRVGRAHPPASSSTSPLAPVAAPTPSPKAPAPKAPAPKARAPKAPAPSAPLRGPAVQDIPEPNGNVALTNPVEDDLPPDPTVGGDDELPAAPRVRLPAEFRKQSVDAMPQNGEFDGSDVDEEDYSEEDGWSSDASDEETQWRSEVVAQSQFQRESVYSNEGDKEEVSSTVLDKMAKKRAQVTQEILDTESTYVSSLDLVQTIFMASCKSSEKLVSAKDIEEIFLNAEELCNLHKGVLAELVMAIADTRHEPAMGAFFCKVAPYLHIYSRYTTHFERGQNRLGELMAKNTAFADLIKACQDDVRCNNRLPSYLLEPIQRIPRYKLLLQEYQKRLPDGHPDVADTQLALELIKDVATSVNEHIRERETKEQLEELQEKFPSNFAIVKPGRKLIMTATLQKICRKGPQERAFFLFSDALVYCAHGSVMQNEYINPKELPLVSMRAEEIEVSLFGQTHCIELSSRKKSFLFATGSLTERSAWLNAIKEAIAAITETDPKSPAAVHGAVGVGMQAPMWIPDKGVSMCQLCSLEFSFVRRRHHCRLCGKVICGPCSANQVPIKYMGGKPGRVCDDCYRMGQTKDGVGNVTSKRQNKIRENVGKKRTILAQAANGMKGNKDSIISGFLNRKKGGLLRGSQRMWYVLKKDFVLYTYVAPEDIVAQDSMPMPGRSVTPGEGKDGELVFRITTNVGNKVQKVGFEVESAELCKKWMDHLVRASRAQAETDDESDEEDQDYSN